jgi:hypothetical protein
LASSDALLCPCAAGCLENCIWASRQGDPHITNAQTNSIARGGKTLEVIFSATGCLTTEIKLQVTRRHSAATMNRNHPLHPFFPIAMRDQRLEKVLLAQSISDLHG